MKTYQVTHREGEYLGPVDWEYDFYQHSDKKDRIDEAVEKLKTLEENPGMYEATTDGGWPRCGWGSVGRVGMYDGWPYWRPVPSVWISSHYGGSWHSFSSITSIRKKKDGSV